MLQQGDEGVAPAVDGIAGIAGRHRPGLLRLIAEERDIGRAVVVLQPGCHLIGLHLGEGGERLVNAILQEQIVGRGELVVVVELCMVRKQREEAVVLFMDPAIDDLPSLAQGMGAGIDQWFVLQVLVLVTGDRVERQDRAADRPAALGDDLFHVQQVLPGRFRGVVEQGKRPERGIISVPFTQQLQDRLEERPVPHAEGDLLQVQGMDVLAAEERQHFLVAAVLRDIIPGSRVDLAGLLDDLEDSRLGCGDELLVPGHLDRVVSKLAREREVEEIVKRLRPVRFQVEQQGFRELAVADRDGADRKLQQHGQSLAGGGRVGDDHLASVDGVNQELVGDELVDALAVLLAEAVALAVEVLADEDGGLAGWPLDRPDFLLEGNDRTGRREGHLALLEDHVVLGGLERQVEHGQSEDHLREVA